MIEAEFMMLRTKEAYEASKLAYDASSALRANVQVSALVSAFLLESLPYLDFYTHWVFFVRRVALVRQSLGPGVPGRVDKLLCCFFFVFGRHSDRADLSEWIPFQWEHA